MIAKFPRAFVSVPSEIQSICMRMAIMALSSSEQFTLRAAIEFLASQLCLKSGLHLTLLLPQVSVMHTSRNSPAISEAYEPLINSHGRDIVEAVITGGAVASPRSTIPNYAEILVAVIVRTPTCAKSWIENLMAIVSLDYMHSTGRG